MPDEKAKLVLEMQDKASASIDRVQSSYAQFTGSVAAGNLIAKAAEKAMGLLKEGIGELVNATQVAARIEVLNHVFQMTGERAGYTTAQLETTKQKMMALGIAEQEALQIGQRFIQSQLDIADATKVARAAQDLAVIANTNSSETALQLTDAILKQRPILLKQFGIIADLNDIYGAQALALHKTVDELNETEKRQAFLNEILRQSQTVAGSYERAMEDVGKQVTSLPRYLQQAENAVGKHFLPVMRLAVGAAKEFLVAVEQAFSPDVDLLVKSTNKLVEQREKFDATTVKAKALRDEYAQLKAVVEPTADQHQRMNDILRELERVMPGAVLAIEGETGAMRSNLDVLDDLLNKRVEHERQREDEQLAAVAREYNLLAGQIQDYSTKLEYARDVVYATTTATDAEREALIAKHRAIWENSAALGGFSRAQADASARIDAMQGKFQGITSLFDKYGNQVKELPGQIDQLNEREDRLLLAMSNMYPNLENNVDAQTRLGEQLTAAVLQYQEEQRALEASNEAMRQRQQMVEYHVGATAGWSEASRQFFSIQDAGWRAEHENLKPLPADLDQIEQSNRDLAAVEHAGAVQFRKDCAARANDLLASNRRILANHTENVEARRALEAQLARDMRSMTSSAVDGMLRELIGGRGRMGDVFKGMANDFLRYFVKQGLGFLASSFIPGLGGILGSIFDTPANDRMAMQQGEHFASFFTDGALNTMANFPANFAALASGGAAVGAAAAIGGSSGSGGARIVINNPVMDRRFVSETLEPILVSNSAAGMSDIVINQDNLTGYDNARIV